ncbi:MAG: hypothetical protein D4R84_04200 [Rhodocyclaceae bacterium]|nr:MAG: hypothetical protein D4R84_04200 [Rhodocyclaceae bacterium]
MGFSSLLGGLFGGNAEKNYDSLSLAELKAQMAVQEDRAEEIRTLLKRAGGDQAARDKSAQWLLKMQQSAAEAEKHNDVDQLKKIEHEIAESQKRMKKIEDGASEMQAELLAVEDEIELLTRALAKKQKS